MYILLNITDPIILTQNHEHLQNILVEENPLNLKD
jgi:hypothetical protein